MEFKKVEQEHYIELSDRIKTYKFNNLEPKKEKPLKNLQKKDIEELVSKIKKLQSIEKFYYPQFILNSNDKSELSFNELNKFIKDENDFYFDNYIVSSLFSQIIINKDNIHPWFWNICCESIKLDDLSEMEIIQSTEYNTIVHNLSHEISDYFFDNKNQISICYKETNKIENKQILYFLTKNSDLLCILAI